MYEQYQDQGFVVITALGGATDDEVADWVDQFGLTHPVIADTNFSAYGLAGKDTSSISWPYVLLLDRGLVIEEESTSATSVDVSTLL